MKTGILAYYAGRLLLAALFFLLLAIWEKRAPWRARFESQKTRWLRHLSLQAIGQVVSRLLFPLATISIAFLMQEKDMGVLNRSHLPYLSQLILGILALDFAFYLQHRLLHKNPLLWRVHRVHHMDRHLEISTGLRFHPLEELFSMAIKTLAIAFLGIVPLAVVIFEIGISFAFFFTHANIYLKPTLEKNLRRLIVTPVMHRLHHSDLPFETNSNYGFCLSVWDRLLGTYRPATYRGEEKLLMGLEGYEDPKYQTLSNMLLIPFNPKYLSVRKRKPMATKFKGEIEEMRD